MITSTIENKTRNISNKFQFLFSFVKYLRPWRLRRRTSSIKKNMLQAYPDIFWKSDSVLCVVVCSTPSPMITELKRIMMVHVVWKSGCSTTLLNDLCVHGCGPLAGAGRGSWPSFDSTLDCRRFRRRRSAGRARFCAASTMRLASCSFSASVSCVGSEYVEAEAGLEQRFWNAEAWRKPTPTLFSLLTALCLEHTRRRAAASSAQGPSAALPLPSFAPESESAAACSPLVGA
mmetsp:Transcript_63629/g.197466  ORF Transcript_63629/g.197466 Transcript_63629/m.197466 type:complete len:232 (+) Transcript_63629:1059-1754(+)